VGPFISDPVLFPTLSDATTPDPSSSRQWATGVRVWDSTFAVFKSEKPSITVKTVIVARKK
jgi:hypothetical protein